MIISVKKVNIKDTELTRMAHNDSKVFAEYGKNSVTSKHFCRTSLKWLKLTLKEMLSHMKRSSNYFMQQTFMRYTYNSKQFCISNIYIDCFVFFISPIHWLPLLEACFHNHINWKPNRNQTGRINSTSIMQLIMCPQFFNQIKVEKKNASKPILIQSDIVTK